MKIFPITFRAGCVELDAIVTASDSERRFKIELVTGEPDPIVLIRSEDSSWIIESHGGRKFSEDTYHEIIKKIEAFIASIS